MLPVKLERSRAFPDSMREAFLTIHDRFFNHKLQRIVGRL